MTTEVLTLREVKVMFDEWFIDRTGRSSDLNYPQDARLWEAYKAGVLAMQGERTSSPLEEDG